MDAPESVHHEKKRVKHFVQLQKDLQSNQMTTSFVKYVDEPMKY